MNFKTITNKTIGAILLLMFFATSCSTEPENEEVVIKEPVPEEKAPVLETLEIQKITTSSALVIGKVVDRGTSSVIEQGASYSTSGLPTIDDNTIKANKVSGSGEFEVQLSGLQDDVVYKLRTYAINKQGTAYSSQMEFRTAKAEVPTLKTSAVTVAGAHVAFVDAELLTQGGAEVTEKGVVWSKSESPTIEDEKLDLTEEKNIFKARIDGLDPNTKYYVRSYAINDEGAGYGEQVQVKTIQEGSVTYTIHKEANPSEDLKAIYARLEEAFEEATYYYNEFTSIQKHVNVYYNPGVQTADGSINGTIRFGSNVSYQRAGTAMHEIMHTVGVGQHWKWNELISGGTYKGARANKILQMMTNSSSATIKGDGTHFWPYGINGAHEDTGDEMLYTIHALVLQGMKADGLPSSN